MKVITAATAALLSGISVAAANKEDLDQQQQCSDTNSDGSCNASDADSTTSSQQQRQTNDETNTVGEGLIPPGQCALYLAPSSLPHAGLGLYSGLNIPFDQSINDYIGGTYPGYNDDDDPPLWTDLILPILDQYKALPHRGQQRFPSYLSYIYPEYKGALSDLNIETKPFPSIPVELRDFDTGFDRADGIEYYIDDLPPELADELKEYFDSKSDSDSGYISAFVPGLGMLANSHSELNNADRLYEYELDRKGHLGIEFVAIKEVTEGMELLINYGDEWEDANDDKLEFIEKQQRKKSAEIRETKGHVAGIDRKWDLLDKRELYQCLEDLPTEKAKRERLAEGFAADSSEVKEDGARAFSEYRENDHHPWDDETSIVHEQDDVDDDTIIWGEYPSMPQDIMKPLPWLNDNGICLSAGKLRVGPSSIEIAGRGVHATTTISKGETILPSPLIAMRKEDFIIYKSDPKQEQRRFILDKETILGMEVLYNYAFTHPNSPLYLVPTAPLANFINHGCKGANVQIRWPEEGSNTAKLFEWAYNQKHGSHFDADYDASSSSNNNPWLKDHPIDVLERSGRLAFEYVALRDIGPGEEILIDYGELWNEAWTKHSGKHFRQPIGVPENFFPKNWLNVGDRYEVAEIKGCTNGSCDDKPLEPGVAVPLTWAHNGKPISSKYAYAVGLEKGFSERFLEYSKRIGMIELYRKLLTEQEGYHLPSDGFEVYNPATLVNSTDEVDKALEFFAHRYATATWNLKFNMHFVAAWSEAARRSVLSALGDAGFDLALKGIAERFGYDNMTCFHSSYMGITHCEKSIMHTDIYATNDQSWNFVFPLVTVDGTPPELDLLSEDMNTVVGVNYLKDVVYAMGDFGYHQTIPMVYYDPGEDDSVKDDPFSAGGVPIRVVFGTYCSQIDESNIAMIRQIYDGDDPAPFADQFTELPMREIHYSRGSDFTMSKPGGKTYSGQ